MNTEIDKNKRPNIKIVLPNLLMIPGLSLIFSIIKLCGGVSWDWATTLVVIPVTMYAFWSFFFLGVVALCLLISKLTRIKD